MTVEGIGEAEEEHGEAIQEGEAFLLKELVRHPGESVGEVGKRNQWTWEFGMSSSKKQYLMITRRYLNPSQIFIALNALGHSILTQILKNLRSCQRPMTKGSSKLTLWMKLNGCKKEISKV